MRYAGSPPCFSVDRDRGRDHGRGGPYRGNCASLALVPRAACVPVCCLRRVAGSRPAAYLQPDGYVFRTVSACCLCRPDPAPVLGVTSLLGRRSSAMQRKEF